MPIIRNIETGAVRCCIWRVSECADELLRLLPDDGTALREEAFARFANEKRRLEFIAVRVLLYHMLGRLPVVAYYPDGRPYLTDQSYEISVSHTQGIVAVILSPCHTVGVDVEQYGLRVERVFHKFLGEDEYAPGTWEKLLIWSAKETVFKMMHCTGVDFRRHLTTVRMIHSGVLEPGSHGWLELHTSHPAHSAICRVCFELYPDFVLTYSSDTFYIQPNEKNPI